MRTAILGAGPAGLYLAILLKRSEPGHQVTVYERNPPDATFGWGVVFSEETLGALRDADYPSYLEITDTFARWDAIDVSYRDTMLRSRGHAFSAIARTRLLGILQRRAAELDVTQRFGVEVDDLDTITADADLLVGADGVRSVVRSSRPEAFGTTVTPQGCKYIWFGTDLVFDAFRFIFSQTEHGLFQVHGYPFDENTSTFIVECPEPTLRAAGLADASTPDTISFCEKLFADELSGHHLMSNNSSWLTFPRVRNRAWHTTEERVPTVLVGDAAHTAHFTIGSGTKLAMEDSIALVNAFVRHGSDSRQSVQAALAHYEQERRPVIERFQQAASESADYFSRVRYHAHLEPPQFVFNLLTRSGRISHLNLALRDPDFVRTVDSWFASGGASLHRVSPPPAFTPLQLGELRLRNRIARTGIDDWADAAHDGAGLVLSELVAATEDGRRTPQTVVLRTNSDADRLRARVAAAHSEGGAVSLLLGHAGSRAASRPPDHGVDIPLPESASWPVVAASAVPYGPYSQLPRAMDTDDLSRVREGFAGAALLAAEADFDMLELDAAHGRLLAGFLSPLTNHRTDEFGGGLDNRTRYPLEVLAAVRAVWPDDRPLAVRLSVTDWARGGLSLDDGVRIARAMADAGVDLIHVVAGQTVTESRPDYRRGYLTALSDRVRSEARIATLVGGHLATIDAVNTVLAAGRADICVAEFPPPREAA
ncbi:MAG: FAD-dependent monooxygenase [Haloechinothrix sp.]